MTEPLPKWARARLKLERRAARGPGFSNYANRKIKELMEEQAEENRIAAEAKKLKTKKLKAKKLKDKENEPEQA